MKTLATIIGAVIFAAVIVVAFAALLSLPVLLLWNWLMPAIFGLPAITWPQAWGLLVLCGFLFKSTHPTVSGKDK